MPDPTKSEVARTYKQWTEFYQSEDNKDRQERSLMERLGQLPLQGPDRDFARRVKSDYLNDFGYLSSWDWARVKQLNALFRRKPGVIEFRKRQGVKSHDERMIIRNWRG